jgi:hypothetical protein
MSDVDNLINGTTARKPGDFDRHPTTGAPYVMVDGKRRMYGRPSSFGAPLDNSYNLMKWKERQLLIGVAALEPVAIDPADRDELDRYAAACHHAAGSHLAAERGTHAHLLIEHHTNGLDPAELHEAGELLGIPAALQARLVDQWAAFRTVLGVRSLACEMTVVHDRWRLAGTLDNLDHTSAPIETVLGTIDGAFIGDIKTGSMTLGRDGLPMYWVKYPLQLAAYAGGLPYNTDLNQRYDWPAIPDQNIALIYHYDMAAALAGEWVDWQAIPVDLQAGVLGGDLVKQTAEFGKRRNLFATPIKSPTLTPLEDVRARITAIIEAGHADTMRQRWPEGVPTLASGHEHTADELAAIVRAVGLVEAQHGMPFIQAVPPLEQPAGETAAPSAVVAPDDGGEVPASTVAALRSRMEALPSDRLAEVTQIATEAHAAGWSISVQQKPCERRYRLAAALVAWAESDAVGHDLLCAAGLLSADDQMVDLNQTMGALIGQFTIVQATSLHDTFAAVTGDVAANAA